MNIIFVSQQLAVDKILDLHMENVLLLSYFHKNAQYNEIHTLRTYCKRAFAVNIIRDNRQRVLFCETWALNFFLAHLIRRKLKAGKTSIITGNRQAHGFSTEKYRECAYQVR